MKSTQSDIVREFVENETKPLVTKLETPMIKSLHTKTYDDMAQYLMNILRSQKDLREFKWVIGEYIQLTSDP